MYFKWLYRRENIPYRHKGQRKRQCGDYQCTAYSWQTSCTATFLGDVLKAVIPVLITRFFITGPDGWYLLCLYMGLGVVLGHNYPFYLKFKGGKGIAVTAAVVLSTSHPLMVPAGILIFVAVVAITRYVSLGSLFVAWYIPVNSIILYHDNKAFVHIMVISLLFTVLAYFQHRQNIVRLLHGNENKLWGNKKD